MKMTEKRPLIFFLYIYNVQLPTDEEVVFKVVHVTNFAPESVKPDKVYISPKQNKTKTIKQLGCVTATLPGSRVALLFYFVQNNCTATDSCFLAGAAHFVDICF